MAIFARTTIKQLYSERVASSETRSGSVQRAEPCGNRDSAMEMSRIPSRIAVIVDDLLFSRQHRMIDHAPGLGINPAIVEMVCIIYIQD